MKQPILNRHVVSFYKWGKLVCFAALSQIILVVGIATKASSATVVTNLSNTATSNWNVLEGFGTSRDVASSFTTGIASGYELNSATLFMDNASFPGGGFSLSLYSDSAGLPGSNLGVIFSGSSDPATNGFYTYTASSPYALSASTKYWLVASVAHPGPTRMYPWLATSDFSETSPLGWSIGNTAFLQPVSGSWSLDSSNTQMFSIDATAAAPEPSRATLMVAALCMLVLRRRR